MGSSQSSPATVTPVSSTKIPNESTDADPNKPKSKVLDTPIFMDNDGDQEQNEDDSKFPSPSGHEYDLMDKIAAELPGVIDEESRQQVDDYMQACDGGRGPMVACFATAEFISLFERKHQEAFKLYENTCFRPKKDKSPNGVLVDGTKAYPPGCFNLAQVLMTGKGGNKFDRAEGYKMFDRACRGGHGGACHMQAKMLLSAPGELGKGVPYNPRKAASLLQDVCDNGDPISCFTLATMLLRGDQVVPEADNVSPQEARGEADLMKRANEQERAKSKDDKRVALKRDPPRAEKLLTQACMTNGHAPSCYNLAVMYTQGDDGVPVDPEKARNFQEKTEEMVQKFGGFGM
mmetsp:Transcript_2599/g.3789  ORF Transcript_2599/g.3789 Transcript_2599/m.3789 type:complete len:347 (+) Transcript_2599:151-1191(+)